ncbi:MAG: M23 family metallopeptidase [Chloroflexi bacterium]|nr:M23 family metallopeptidase [Chloroflexota bacterium]
MGQRDDTPFLVLAARSGTVTQVVQGYDTGRDCDPSLTGRGNSVLLDHGDKIGSIYLHLLKNSAVVKVGDRVEQGQPLGRSGRTGYVCGVAHLHFTVVQLPNMMGLDIPFGDPSLAAEGGRPKTNGWYPSSNAQTGPVMLAPLRYQIFVPFMARRAPRP